MSWLGRLREDHRKRRWSDWLEIMIPGYDALASMARGIRLIFKGDPK